MEAIPLRFFALFSSPSPALFLLFFLDGVVNPLVLSLFPIPAPPVTFPVSVEAAVIESVLDGERGGVEVVGVDGCDIASGVVG